MIEFPFLGGTRPGRSVFVNSQRTINLYPIPTVGGKESTKVAPIPIAMERTPGLKKLIDFDNEEEVRGMLPFNGYLIVVCGPTVYKCTAGGDFTAVGGVATSTGRVSMAASPDELMIVDGVNGYIYNGTTTTQITDSTFVTLHPDDAIYVDSRFLVNEPGSGRMWKSALLDGFTWTALGYTTAETKPDNLVKLLEDHNTLVAFGTEGIDFYTNTGNVDFPFEPVRNLYQEFGLKARASVAQVDNTIYWLGQSINGGYSVYRFTKGPGPERASDDDIDYLLSTMTEPDEAIADSIVWQGHPWYVLTFPYDNRTLVYDASAQLWFEWAYTPSDRIPEDLRRHRMNCHAFFGGKNMVGDFENGKIYTLEKDVHTDDGQHIRWMRQAPILHNNRGRIFLDTVQIDMQVGVGLNSGQGSDPLAILEVSRDGGQAFGTKRYISMGKTGEHIKRFIARQLGAAYDFVIRLSGSEPVETRILGGYVNVEKEPE